jgi:hypothetical protein
MTIEQLSSSYRAANRTMDQHSRDYQHSDAYVRRLLRIYVTTMGRDGDGMIAITGGAAWLSARKNGYRDLLSPYSTLASPINPAVAHMSASNSTFTFARAHCKLL